MSPTSPPKIIKISRHVSASALDLPVLEGESAAAAVDISEDESCQGSQKITMMPMRTRKTKTSFLKFTIHAVLVWLTFLMVRSLLSSSKSGKGPSPFELIFRNSTLFPHLEHHWHRIHHSINTATTSSSSLENERNHNNNKPGLELARRGATPKYPILMIPGFVTSGLELWAGHECAQKYFRQRLWGSLMTARSFFTERDCWVRHLSLDPLTGGDPEKIRLRAAQGFDAADYFMTAYWVWDKLISNLADLGYDASSMNLFSYDWRLAFPLLEQRDGYFTKLKANIEAMHKTNGEKVVLASHSMGSLVVHYFFAWVVSPEGGGGGSDWVDKHVHTFINIAGPMLGVPKAIPSILSGEMKDTNIMMGTFGSMLENFFGRRRRKELWGSWGSLWAMFPKGGDAIWGPAADLCSAERAASLNQSSSCRRLLHHEKEPAPFISMSKPKDDKDQVSADHDNNEGDDQQDKTDDKMFPIAGQKQSVIEAAISEYASKATWSLDETLDFLRIWGAGYGPQHASNRLLSLSERDGKKKKELSWHDPTRTPLPFAPNLKIYCMYGVGIDTERSFYYQHNCETEGEEVTATVQSTTIPSLSPSRTAGHSPFDLPFIMDGTFQDADENVAYGVKTTDGDASVPLLSLGYMCVEGWKTLKHNPSKSTVITREYQHHQEFSVDDPMRGGPLSADHVDILGNRDMTSDFLRIVSDFEIDQVQDRIHSDIVNIVQEIRQHPLNSPTTKDRSQKILPRFFSFKQTPSNAKETREEKGNDTPSTSILQSLQLILHDALANHQY